MNNLPQISVVMTAFNAQDFISEAMDSILNQTFKDFEFIIVDNYSSDKTVDIIRSFKDPRIVLIVNGQNLGQTKALNVGLRLSRGRYIARMDADDISFLERFQIQYDFLQSNQDIAVVGSWCWDIDKQGKLLRVYKTYTDPVEVTCSLAVSGDLSQWCISHPTVMMRRDVLEAIGFYREEPGGEFGYPQDYELWSRMIVAGYKFANINKPLLKYRILNQSESRGPSQELLRHRFEISRRKVKQLFPQFNEDEVFLLTSMLEFQSLPRGHSNTKEVYKLFDQYFTALFSKFPSTKVVLFREQLKFFYLPMLLTINKMKALKYFFQIVLRYPIFLLNGRFYRKMGKVFLSSILSSKFYIFLTRKVLSLR